MQQRVSLLERGVIGLQGVIVARPALGQQHIHKPPPSLGRAAHDVQILGREHHARDMPHQLARARGGFAVDVEELALFLQGRIQPHAHLIHAVGALHAHLHGGGLLPGADHLPVEGRAVAAPQAAQVNGLEQVGFARAVFAHKHRYPRWGREQHLMIAAKIVQPQRLDKHYL